MCVPVTVPRWCVCVCVCVLHNMIVYVNVPTCMHVCTAEVLIHISPDVMIHYLFLSFLPASFLPSLSDHSEANAG